MELARIHTTGRSEKTSRAYQSEEKTTAGVYEVNQTTEGRYPANFIISEDIAPILDKQSGILKSGGGDFRKKNGTSMFFKGEDKRELKIYQANQGGASRFFYNAKIEEEDYMPFYYTAKASKKENGKNIWLKGQMLENNLV